MKFKMLSPAKIAQRLQACAVGSSVELGGHHDQRLFRKSFAESRQFARNHFIREEWIVVVRIAGVDQVDKQPRAFDVTKKAHAQAGAFVRALDQSRKVSNHERAP